MSVQFNSSTSTQFTVSAQVEPSVLPRVLGFFAQDNFVPTQVKSRVFKGGDLVIDVTVPALSEQRASVIAEKLRQLVTVRKVRLEHQVAATVRAA